MRIQDNFFMRAGRLSLRGLDNGCVKNSRGCVVVKFNFRSWHHQVNKANPSSTKILHVVWAPGRRRCPHGGAGLQRYLYCMWQKLFCIIGYNYTEYSYVIALACRSIVLSVSML